MRIRPYTDSDLDALRRMHASQGFDYPFPNLDDPIFISKLVLEDDSGRPVMAALARLTCEMYLLIDRTADATGSPGPVIPRPAPALFVGDGAEGSAVDLPPDAPVVCGESACHDAARSSSSCCAADHVECDLSRAQPRGGLPVLSAVEGPPPSVVGACSDEPLAIGAALASVEAQGSSPCEKVGASAPSSAQVHPLVLSAVEGQHVVEFAAASADPEFASPHAPPHVAQVFRPEASCEIAVAKELASREAIYANDGSPTPFPSVEAWRFSPTNNDGASAPSIAQPHPQRVVEFDSPRDVADAPGSAEGGSRAPQSARRAARERWAQLLALHRAGELDLFARGLDDAHAWLPPQIAKRFGRRLACLGWFRDDAWTPYCKILRPNG